jgi:hypothetical protein
MRPFKQRALQRLYRKRSRAGIRQNAHPAHLHERRRQPVRYGCPWCCPPAPAESSGSVLLGGLAPSTVFTLFVVPALLSFFIGFEHSRASSIPGALRKREQSHYLP